MKLDPTQRKFTIDCPIHTDLHGGVIRILSTNGITALRGRKMPIIALRYQAGSDELSEEYYTMDGGWDLRGEPSNFDLWDADLTSIKPLPLTVVTNVA